LAYLPAYLDWRIKKGLFVEVASPTYEIFTMQALFLLARFSEDATIAAKARMLLDLLWADWAQDQVARVRGGGKSRVYTGGPSITAAIDALNGIGSVMFGGTLPGPSHLSPFTFGTGYLPPQIVI